MSMYEIRRYQTETGREPFTEWLLALKDQDARKAIIRRISRLENGNFGDYKPCSGGVWELRIDVGQGYRVYYGQARH